MATTSIQANGAYVTRAVEKLPPRPDSLFFNKYPPAFPLLPHFFFPFFFHRQKPKSTICKGSLMLMFGAGFICMRQRSSPVKQSDTLTRVRLLGEPPTPPSPGQLQLPQKKSHNPPQTSARAPVGLPVTSELSGTNFIATQQHGMLQM